jgi:hypothetical protein
MWLTNSGPQELNLLHPTTGITPTEVHVTLQATPVRVPCVRVPHCCTSIQVQEQRDWVRANYTDPEAFEMDFDEVGATVIYAWSDLIRSDLI